MRERERIAHYFAPLTTGEPGSFSLTDDAAALAPPTGKQLIITTDSVIQGTHVLPDATPAQYATKLLRRNLSDLAAMGATPWRYSLNLHTPRHTPDTWFAEFAAALLREQEQFGLVLFGGDTTSGGEVIHTTLTCIGVSDGPLLRRHGAQAEDDVYVSGTIGDAAVGLQSLLHNTIAAPALIDRYHTPQPRLALGQALLGIATSAIDISDGLLQDISQLCRSSEVGAAITREHIPRSAALQQLLDHDAILWDSILGGGDDYELCFTAPASKRETITALAQTLALPLTRIGTITDHLGLQLRDEAGNILPLPPMGWEYR